MNVTDTSAQAPGEWRYADARSEADAASLSDYEQALSNHERDAGIVTAACSDDVTLWRRRRSKEMIDFRRAGRIIKE